MEKTRKETKEAIKKAKEILEEISKDKHERELAEYREKYIRDQMAIEDYGFDRGLEQGEKKKQEEMIKSMKENGIALEIIAKIANLPIEDVQKILEN